LDDAFTSDTLYSPLERLESQWLIRSENGSIFALCSQIDLQCVTHTIPNHPGSIKISNDGEILLLAQSERWVTKFYEWRKEGKQYVQTNKLLDFPNNEYFDAFSHDNDYLLTNNYYHNQITLWDYETLTPLWTLEKKEDRLIMKWLPLTHYMVAFRQIRAIEVHLELYSVDSPEPIDTLNVTNLLTDEQREGAHWCMECPNMGDISRNGDYVQVDLYVASVIVPIVK
jgi:WD40 repeat protein